MSASNQAFIKINQTYYFAEESELGETDCLHIAWRFEEDVLTFFINGSLISSIAGVSLWSSFQATMWQVGFSDPLGLDGFDAAIEEVRVWYNARDYNEIYDYAKKPIPFSEQDRLHIYIPHIEGGGFHLYDPKNSASLALFPSANGHSSTHDPIWASEDCVNDFMVSGISNKLGSLNLTCTNTSGNNLICNGDLNQYDPIFVTGLGINVPASMRHHPFIANGGGYTDFPNWKCDPTTSGFQPYHLDSLEASYNLYPVIGYPMNGPWVYYLDAGIDYHPGRTLSTLGSEAAIAVEQAVDSNGIWHTPKNWLETLFNQSLDTNKTYRFSFYSLNHVLFDNNVRYNPGGLAVEWIDSNGALFLLDTFLINQATFLPQAPTFQWNYHEKIVQPTQSGIIGLRLSPTKPPHWYLDTTTLSFINSAELISNNLGSNQRIYLLDNFSLADVTPLDTIVHDCFPRTITALSGDTAINHHYASREVATDADSNSYLAVEYKYITSGFNPPHEFYIQHGPGILDTDSTQLLQGISISKYNSCGELIWSTLIEGKTELIELDVDANGKVFVFGNYTDSIHCDGIIRQTPEWDPFVTRLNANGGAEYIFANQTQTPNRIGIQRIYDGSLIDQNTLLVIGQNLNTAGHQDIFGMSVDSTLHFIATFSGIQTTNQFSGTTNSHLFEKVNLGEHVLFGNHIYVGFDSLNQVSVRQFEVNNLNSGPIKKSDPIMSINSCQSFEIADLVLLDSNLVIGLNTKCDLTFSGTTFTRGYTTSSAQSALYIAADTSNLVWHLHYHISPYVYNSGNGEHASGKGVSLHEMATRDDSVLVGSLFSDNYNLSTLGLDSSYHERHLLVKVNNSLQGIWKKTNSGAPNLQNCGNCKSTAIAASALETDLSFIVAGNYVGQQKLFDIDTLVAVDTTAIQVYITRVYDFGYSAQFKQRQPTLSSTSIITKVYPNPGNAFLTVQSTIEEVMIQKVRIFNLHGQFFIDKENMEQNKFIQIDTHTWPNGSYIVQIIDAEGKITHHKWIKQ